MASRKLDLLSAQQSIDLLKTRCDEQNRPAAHRPPPPRQTLSNARSVPPRAASACVPGTHAPSALAPTATTRRDDASSDRARAGPLCAGAGVLSDAS
eukprot:4248136-Prymnesium_polylepis.1